MTWPAPTLPIDFTNATAQQDLHPDAHNVTNQTLNDDYRPELTRVGDLIAGTISVYQGDDPAGNAVIVGDTVRIKTRLMSRYTGTEIAGRIRYDPSNTVPFRNANTTTPIVTTGGTPVPFLGVQFTTANGLGWPNGGYLDVMGTCLLRHKGGTGQSIAQLSCGIGLPPAPFTPGDPVLVNEPTTWPSTTSRSRIQLTAPVVVSGVDVGTSEAGLFNSFCFEIPPGTTDGVWGWIGVAHTGAPVDAVSGNITVRAWAD